MVTPSFYLLEPKISESSLTLAHHPCPICHEILLVLSLKYIQNPTRILLTSSAAISLIKALPSISHLDYCNSFLTCLPASTLDPPYVCFQQRSQSNPLKVNQIMSLLCSKLCNDAPSHSEEKPVFSRVHKTYTVGPCYVSTSFPTLSPAHSTPQRPLYCSWKYETLTHFKALKWLFLLPGIFISHICTVYSPSHFMSLFN